MSEWRFNKGEWAEAYVFLKLLGDGRIYGADENQNRDKLIYLDILLSDKSFFKIKIKG